MLEEGKARCTKLRNPRKTSTYVQDLQKALRADDETIQKVARQILEKREQYSWKEAFVISLDLYADQKFFFSEDAPEQIIVCSTSYDSILEDNMSICQSITKLHYEPQHTTDQWASLWIKKYLKSVFQYPEKVRGIKMWYGLGTASA